MNTDIAYLEVSDLRLYPAVYHSLQTPGWVSWAGIVQLRTGDILVGFNEVTGSRCPATPAPLEPGMAFFGNDSYNFRGLNRSFRIIEAVDTKIFFARWRDRFIEPLPDSHWQPGIHFSLETAAGTLLRHTQGRRLPQNYRCAAISRSVDQGRTWSGFAPIYPQADAPGVVASRIITLRDGRLLMSAYWRRDEASPVTDAHLLVSEDDGISWSAPIKAMVGDAEICPNEAAIVELRNGDILMLARVADLTAPYQLDAHGKSVGSRWNRRQVRLRKQGKTWVPGTVETLDIPHGGQPELLPTREGILLYVATEGIWGSIDDGRDWTRIKTLPTTFYYPVSVQLDDGRILVVGHNGGDAGYPPTADMMLWKIRIRIAGTKK
jgi:hypothetical protein